MTDFSYAHRIQDEQLAIMRKFTASVPVRVGALASALGLKVVLATLPLNISGLIKPDESGEIVVKVNRFESKERQRFTIAHEIAHFLLHRDKIDNGIVDSVLYRSKLSSRIEAEANKLAADIIMPVSAVYPAMRRFGDRITGDDIASLALEFGVSRQAMEIRVS